jgi:hypothetical protein
MGQGDAFEYFGFADFGFWIGKQARACVLQSKIRNPKSKIARSKIKCDRPGLLDFRWSKNSMSSR